MKLIEIKVGMDLFTSRIVSSKPVVQGENLVTRIMAEFPSEYAEWSHFVEFRSGTQHILLPLDKNDEVNVPEEFSAINFPKLEVQFQCRNAQQVAVDQTVLYIDVLKGTNVVSDFTAPEDELNLMMDHIASYDNPHSVTSEQVALSVGICNLQAQNVQAALVELKQLIDLGGGKAPTDVIQTLKQHDQDITWCKKAVNNLKVDIYKVQAEANSEIAAVQRSVTDITAQIDTVSDNLQSLTQQLITDIGSIKDTMSSEDDRINARVTQNYTEFLNHVYGTQQKFTQYDNDIAALKAAIGGGSGGGDTGDIEAIEKALDELEASVNAMDAANKAVHAALEARVAALETAKEEQAQKIAALEDNVGAISQTTQDLANSVASSASAVGQMQSEVADMKGRVDAVESSISEQDAKIAGLNDNIAALDNTTQNLSAKVTTAVGELNKKTDDLSGRIEVLEDAGGITSDLSDRMAAVEEKAQQNADSISAVRASSEATASDLNAFKSDTERDINRMDSQITAQSEKIGGFDQRVSTAEANIGALSQKALTTDSQIAALDKETENLAAADEALGQRVTALEESDVTTASNIQALQNKDAEQDAKIAGQEARITALENSSVDDDIAALEQKLDSHISGASHEFGRIEAEYKAADAALEQRLDSHISGASHEFGRIEAEYKAADAALDKKVSEHITGASQEFGRLDAAVRELQDGQEKQGDDIRALRQKDIEQDTNLAATNVNVETNAYNIEQMRDRLGKVEESVAGITGDIAEEVEKIAGPIIEQKVDEAVAGSLGEYVTKTELNTEVTKVVTQKISELVDSGDVVTKTEVENIVNEALAPAIAEATKDFVTDAEMEAAIQEALQGVTVDAYTKAEADERFALKTDIPDLSDYALKSEIPDVSGLATKEEVTELQKTVEGQISEMGDAMTSMQENITNLQTGLTNVYTKEEADGKFATTGESGSVYTKTEVDNMIEQVQTTATVEWSPLETPVEG